jgi:hypothetical protein
MYSDQVNKAKAGKGVTYLGAGGALDQKISALQKSQAPVNLNIDIKGSNFTANDLVSAFNKAKLGVNTTISAVK